MVPGAQYASDITMDRAEIFETLAAKLTDFREHGGKTIVDSTGMFHGRDVKLYEALSRSTGVHIVASTGMGPEEMLGGYFLTPQTNPPTPWPAEKFADLFAKEVTEGMVVPRVERRGAAGIVATTADRAGMTPTEESLFRGAARAAWTTGVPVSHPLRRRRRCTTWTSSWTSSSRPTGCSSATWTARTPSRRRATRGGRPRRLRRHRPRGPERRRGLRHRPRARRTGARARQGRPRRPDPPVEQRDRRRQGPPEYDLPYSHVLTTFVPLLKAHGLSDEDAQRILVDNPRNLLTVR